MSINFQFIKSSEHQLFKEFKHIYKFAVESHDFMYETLVKKTDNMNLGFDQNIIDTIQFRYKQVDILINDLLSNCVWNIQKNEPRANHLRFIVAIINSLRDLEFLNNSYLSLLKFFMKRQLSQDIYKHFLEAYKITNNVSHTIIDELEEHNRLYIGNEKLVNTFTEYHKYLKNIIRTSILIYSENNHMLDNKTLIDLITNFGILERMVEHQESIIHAFSYINPIN